jgi:hypothetical protein
MEKSSGHLSNIVWVAVTVAVLYVAWFNFNKFVLTKNYEFYVEAPCDPELETCYLRDCEEEDCPSNELGSYKLWMLSAADFKLCSDDTCATECATGAIPCEVVPCDAEEAVCS